MYTLNGIFLFLMFLVLMVVIAGVVKFFSMFVREGETFAEANLEHTQEMHFIFYLMWSVAGVVLAVLGNFFDLDEYEEV